MMGKAHGQSPSPSDRKCEIEIQGDEEYECSPMEEFNSEDNSVRQPWLSKKISFALYIVLGVLALAVIILAALYGIPILLEKVVIPIMDWEVRELSKPVLALLSVLSLALFPIFLLPTGPTMWLIGVLFGYGEGICLILVGYILGTSFPYFVGHRLFHDRIQTWLSNHPKEAAVLKLADNGNWLYQFRVVFLLRLGPVPYAVLNYAITATSIEYVPYISASVLLLIPEALLAIYVGRLIRALADFHQQKRRRLTPLEVSSQCVGLSLGILVTVIGMYYGRKALKDLEKEEQTPRESIQLLDVEEIPDLPVSVEEEEQDERRNRSPIKSPSANP